ncbi:MAG: hypothetical protein Q4D19_05885 [Lautropia sp.]|nr:hypothetical protein [Lautropia sp.]
MRASLQTRSYLTPVAAALLAAFASFSQPAEARIAQVDYEINFDGTAGFDPMPGPGFDTDKKNGIVRTHDRFAYLVTFSVLATDNNVRVKMTLPKGADGKPIAEWPFLPTECVAGSSTISADRQTIECQANDDLFRNAATKSIILEATVLGSTPNGAVISPVNLEVSSARSGQLTPTSKVTPLTVSAAPFYDIVIENSFAGGDGKPFGFSAGSGPNGENGYYHRPLVGLMARNPNGNGKKGVERLNPDQPIEITLDTSGYPGSVLVDDWRKNNPNDRQRNFADGCGSPDAFNENGYPHDASGGKIIMNGRVADFGPTAVTRSWVVANGGTCNVTDKSRNAVTIQLVGTDTRLTHTPTEGRANIKLPATDHWVANKALVFWTNSSDYPTPINHILKLGRFSAESITGQPMQNGRSDNDSLDYLITPRTAGGVNKLFQPADKDIAVAPYAAVPDPAEPHDRITNNLSPQQSVQATLRYQNSGDTTAHNVVLCDIIDRTAFDIAPNFRIRTVISGSGPTPVYRHRFGARAGGSPYFASTDSAPGAVRAVDGEPAGKSEYAQASCEDPGIQWFDSREAAEQAGGLVYVRTDVDALEGNRQFGMHIDGLVLRRTWANTIQVLSPTPSVRTAGDLIPRDEIVRNTAQFFSDEMNDRRHRSTPMRNERSYDHVKVVPALTRSRVTKTAIEPASIANGAPVPAGTAITYRINSSFATSLPPMAADVVVTDILPAGMRYLVNSSTVGGQTVHPEVQRDTPGAGQTTLIWRFPNRVPYLGGDTEDGAQLPVIEFKARVATTVLDHTMLRNNVAISGGPNDQEPDCTLISDLQGFGSCAKASHAQVRVQTPPGFMLEKIVHAPTVDSGDPFDYVLAATPLSMVLPARDIPDLIDILPFEGDGAARPDQQFHGRNPASRLQPGAVQLMGVTPSPLDPNARIRYTSAAPLQIHNDPTHASNQPGGSTRWCEAAEFGTAGCPASIGDSTAVRISPALAEMRSNQPYEVTLTVRPNPLLAREGDLFANHVGARPVDPASSLLFTASEANVSITITGNYSNLSGKAYSDADKNRQQDGSDRPLPNQCVTLRGTTAKGHDILYSMRTDNKGEYAFVTGTKNRAYLGADCSGNTVGDFPGLLPGTYEISMTGSIARQADGTAIAGNSGGTAGTDRITGITLPRDGSDGSGYDFTRTPIRPKLTLINSVKNDNGGTAQPADFTLAAEHPAGTTTLTGTVQQPAITAIAVDVGYYILSASSLHGYANGTWACTVDGNPATLSGTQLDTLSLDWGDEAVCRIEHDDKPVRLTLEKIVYNTRGGKAAAADFTLRAIPEGSNTPVLDGKSGSNSVTSNTLMPGAYVLSEVNLPGYSASAMWDCSIPLKEGTPDTVVLKNGDDVNCAISNVDMDMDDPSAPNVFIELTSIHVDNGNGAPPNQTQHQDVQLHVTRIPQQGGSTPQTDGPPDVNKGSPVTDNMTRGDRYEIRGSEKRGYTTHLKCWMFNEQNMLTQQPNQGDNLVLIERLTGNISCTTELKRVPTTTDVSKAVVGEARQVAGTANEFEVDYRLTVKHSGGADGHYDLVELPAFDPDVEILETKASRDGTPINVLARDGEWQIASQQELLMDASHEYRVSFRLRVPFGSNEANDNCAAGAGNGLFNQARMTVRNDVSQALQNGTAINAANAAANSDTNTVSTGEACLPTPKAILSSSLAIEKTSSTRSAEVGDLVSYRLRIRNLGEGPALSPVVVDRLPRGFRIEPGSVRVQNARQVGFSQSGRIVQFSLDRVEAGTAASGAAGSTAGSNAGSRSGATNGEVIITYRARVGVGSQEGDGINRVHIECPVPTNRNARQQCSNESRWKIEVTDGVFTEETCVAGQIFVDCNGNSIKDHEELGIPGVRLYLQNGTWMVSDEQGKYSHCGLRPRTHVLKVDSRTLPRRARLVTSSAQNVGDAQSLFVDARKGMLHRVDFIEGSCSNTVVEQVKARQQQGANASVQTEGQHPVLTLDSKQGTNARPRQQGTDRAQKLPASSRH